MQKEIENLLTLINEDYARWSTRSFEVNDFGGEERRDARIAEFADAQRVLRLMLSMPPFDLGVDAVLEWSLHGFE